MKTSIELCIIFGLFALFGVSVCDVVTKSGDNLLVTGNGTVELYLKTDYVGISIPEQDNCTAGQMILCFEGTETVANRTDCPPGFRSFLIGKTTTSAMWADTWASLTEEAITIDFHSNGTTIVNSAPFNNGLTLMVSSNKSVELDIVKTLAGCEVMLTGVSLSSAPGRFGNALASGGLAFLVYLVLVFCSAQ